MKSTFWIENPTSLLKNFNLIPKNTMSFEEQMNCLTRLVFSVFIVLLLFGYKYSQLFFIISIFFIVILYYIQRNNMDTKENFTPKPLTMKSYVEQSHVTNLNTPKIIEKKYLVQKAKYDSHLYQKPVELNFNQSFQSQNQYLVGNANPKTKIAPVNVAPIYDYTYWKESDFTVPTGINKRTVQDFYRSGYYTDESCCDDIYNQKVDNNKEQFSTENYTADYKKKQYISKQEEDEEGEKNIIENWNNGNLYTGSGYNVGNVRYDLPVNYPSNSCQKNSEINKEIFTSTVVPGVYYKNDIIEPLGSNIGISFDQQFPPLKSSVDRHGNLLYTAEDPLTYTYQPRREEKQEFPSNDQVYDPRYNGYGTSYRGYIDKMTGQAKFFYDDVDAIRRPNYIGRSKIDHIKGVDSYGPMRNDEKIFETNKDIRSIAESDFLNSSIGFRTEMMTSLMRKRNAELWQQRLAPQSRAGSFNMGGMNLK